MPDTLNSIALQTSTKMTKEELNALQATGDGTLGKFVLSFDPPIFRSALVHLHALVELTWSSLID